MENDVIKNKESLKAILFIGITTILLMAIGVFFAYAYFANDPNIQNNLALNVTIEEGISAEFTVTGDEDLTIDVSGDKMLNDGIGSVAGTDNTSITVNLTSSSPVICTYDLVWSWNDDSPNEYTISTGATKEFTIQGTDGSNTIDEVQVSNYGASLDLGSYEIFTLGGTIIQDWSFIANFYNVNVVQDNHAGAIYSGKIAIHNAECGGLDTTLSDAIVTLSALGDQRSQKDGSVYKVEHEIFTAADGITQIDAGYRYEGANPDNYVEYNDELWRIIGTFDGSDVGLEEGKQYTKIIRSNPFSTAYPWDWDDINGNGLIDRDEWSELWADASLNALLNNDYLNQAGEFSSTSTDKGLNETARNMIAKFNNQYSKWYTKGYLTGNTQTANDFYSDERQKGYLYTAIGSMYPSDYGYAIYDGGNDDSCVFPSRANMSSCKQYNWLYRSGVNQLLISYGKMGSLLIPSMISSEGQVTMYDISTSTAYFRPALYLEADVLIISGKGSEDDPYKIYKKTKDSSSDTLSDTILALASGIERQSAQTNGGVYRVVSPEVTTPNFTIYKNLTQDEYGSVVEYKASESGALLSAGTLTSNIYTWDSSEGFWEKSYVRGNDGDYYNLVIPIKESGNYRYCFSTHYGSSSNKLKVYITDENSSIYANSKSTISLTSVVGNDCRGLGDITEGQGVRFEYMKGGASGTGVSITLQKMEETVPFGNPGVKYQGKDPNNYVLFNNGELWRIIGTFEGSTIGLEQGEHYTKIIKSASIGNYEWDSSISTTWQDSDLNYYLTNNLYNNLNVNTKDMIEYATWHLGKIQNGDYNASGYYIEERGASGGIIPHQNYIGLMNPSDYGYAMYAGNTNHDCTIETLISNYSASKYGCVNYDWLFNGDEWTISPINLRSSFIVSADGVIGIGGNDTDEYAVRPVLYLKSNVSIEAGEGTLSSPYILK